MPPQNVTSLSNGPLFCGKGAATVKVFLGDLDDTAMYYSIFCFYINLQLRSSYASSTTYFRTSFLLNFFFQLQKVISDSGRLNTFHICLIPLLCHLVRNFKLSKLLVLNFSSAFSRECFAKEGTQCYPVGVLIS